MQLGIDSEPKPTIEEPRSSELYLPKDFPKFLFHGTNPNGAKDIEKKGMAFGTLTPDITRTLDLRFCNPTKGGRIIVIPYKKEIFVTEDLKTSPFGSSYYDIRDNLVRERLIEHSSVDTDLNKEHRRSWSSKHVAKDQISSLQLSTVQLSYLDIVFGILRPDIKLALSEIKSKLLGLTDASVSNITSSADLQQALNEKGGEVYLLQRFIAGFPKPLQWDWKSKDVVDEDIIASMVRQMYQLNIVRHMSSILREDAYQNQSDLILEGQSSEGLKILLKEKGEKEHEMS
jgi:hypothetical protein